MPITECTGDMLASDARVLVIPVNCRGALGAGLAQSFRFWAQARHPDLIDAYKAACSTENPWKRLRPGWPSWGMSDDGARVAVFFPTKDHWQDPSRLDWVAVGLNALICRPSIFAPTTAPRTIAIPRLGCGLGGLAWHDVYPLIQHYVGTMDDLLGGIDARVYV